jgi:glycine cleavage system H lipoate-binding protein
MIPLDRMSSLDCLCETVSFPECAVYNEISHTAEGKESLRGFSIKSGYYYHPKHVWAAPTAENRREARVGIDDFAARVIGRIDRVSVPAAEMPVKENTVCFLLHSGRRTVRLAAPVDGIVKAVNPRVMENPSLLNEDPYAEGWIFSIRLKEDAVNNLYHGNVARKWFESEVERLQRVFASDLGMTATDGGEALTDISARFNDAQWGKIISQFLG